jgi:hypothetical protein
MFKRHLTLIFKVDIPLRDPPQIGGPAIRPCTTSNIQDALGAERNGLSGTKGISRPDSMCGDLA